MNSSIFLPTEFTEKLFNAHSLAFSPIFFLLGIVILYTLSSCLAIDPGKVEAFLNSVPCSLYSEKSKSKE